MSNVYSFNEWVSNKPLVKFEIRKMVNSIQSKLKNKLTNDNFRKRTDNDHNIVYEFINIKDYKLFEKILKNYQSNLLKKGIIVGYSYIEKHPIKEIKDDFDLKYDKNVIIADFVLYIKDLYTERVFPPRYIYHVSNKDNRDNILKNGLELKSWDEGNWLLEPELYYPPSIFAIEDYSDWEYKVGKNRDIWEIDTKGLKNKWQKDLNFYKKMNGLDAYMTFEPIPANHLTLVDDNHFYFREY
jgi:hypothetical protein